jgi:hypothetical protein
MQIFLFIYLFFPKQKSVPKCLTHVIPNWQITKNSLSYKRVVGGGVVKACWHLQEKRGQWLKVALAETLGFYAGAACLCHSLSSYFSHVSHLHAPRRVLCTLRSSSVDLMTVHVSICGSKSFPDGGAVESFNLDDGRYRSACTYQYPVSLPFPCEVLLSRRCAGHVAQYWWSVGPG